MTGNGRGIALAAEGISVRFGGLIALDNVSVRVPTGAITGLIGPNGAGKTTLFNVCTGWVRSSAGSVTLFGREISHASPSTRARLGLGRTFQQIELFDRLTVGENIALGHEARVAGTRALGSVLATRAEKTRTTEACERAIERCGLQDLRNEPVGFLSTGQRRLVELARVFAGDFRVLLLDEPSAGLDRAETLTFGSILRQSVDGSGGGILLVEHNIALVTAVCEYLFVLDFGQLIEEGPTRDVIRSPKVRNAYLGSEVA